MISRISNVGQITDIGRRYFEGMGPHCARSAARFCVMLLESVRQHESLRDDMKTCVIVTRGAFLRQGVDISNNRPHERFSKN